MTLYVLSINRQIAGGDPFIRADCFSLLFHSLRNPLPLTRAARINRRANKKGGIEGRKGAERKKEGAGDVERRETRCYFWHRKTSRLPCSRRASEISTRAPLTYTRLPAREPPRRFVERDRCARVADPIPNISVVLCFP